MTQVFKRWPVWLAVATTAAGCAQQNKSLREAAAEGDFGRARVQLVAKPVTDKGDRAYMLQRFRTLITTVSDGYAYPNNQLVQETFDFLRTQGVNKDRTVLAAITVDNVQMWKGEPFEQALAFYYIAAHFAMCGDWSNMRTACMAAEFPLRSFGKKLDNKGNPTDQDADAETIAGKMGEGKSEGELTGYVVEPTDFALGYLMSGIANRQLAVEMGDPSRTNEANDQLTTAARINPALTAVAGSIRSGNYNTVLLVEYGRGPIKYGRGPDDAIADFSPEQCPSDTRWLDVAVNGGMSAARYPAACDVNVMATNHRWRNLEDVRIAKSYLGTGMMVAGAGVAAVGMSSGNNNTQGAAAIIGLAMIAAGAVTKASAHANVEYCEAVPQRVYVVPLKINSPGASVTLSLDAIDGRRGAKMVLGNLAPPARGTQVRCVRLVETPTMLAAR